jgi:acid phosphatase
MLNDGHNTDYRYADNWLQSFLPPLLKNPYFSKTVFLITFDESDSNFDFKNHIYSVLVGGSVAPGTVDHTRYTHFSQLAFLSENWGIEAIGKGKKAHPFKLD